MRSLNRLLSTGLFLRRCLCTAEVAAEESPSLVRKGDRLYRRLSRLGAIGKTVSETLDEFFRDGGVIKKNNLERCIRELRYYSNFQHALEIMDWMQMRGITLPQRHHAVRLDLIAKAMGISAAKNYFDDLLPSEQNLYTYGALLNCYCQEGLENEALELFKKMDEMNVASTNLAYNNLMSLYMKLGKPEKVAPLVEEMKEKDISPSTFTYCIWIQSYSCLNDIAEVERVMEEVKKDDKEKLDWSIYSNLANAYIKAGDFMKAESALKQLEKVMKRRDRQAYHFLLGLYANTSNLAQVKRIWNVYKSVFPVTNNLSYLVMLQSLSRVRDLVGFKDVFMEWETRCSSYDVRLANIAIKTYLEADMVGEAELVFKRAVKRSAGPFFKAREMFTLYFLENRLIDSALRHMEAAVGEAKDNEWHPPPKIVSKVFDYFHEEMDIDRAEVFIKLLKKVGSCDSMTYNLLVQTYISAGKTVPDIQRRLEEHGIEMNDELEKLLEKESK
ncbi:Pentatricopeptide repeat [Dillenia turbinata]|uniref:Pentatricopeptide repeat n=1 Tax=Dillenia turbinata TaxID=194707 RepID=A0AAN8VLG5_9MAGN